MAEINNRKDSYFEYRQVIPSDYENFSIPTYLRAIISKVHNPHILDFGCGLGQLLRALKNAGFHNVEGLDIDADAIQFCKSQGLDCIDGNGNQSFYDTHATKYDFLIMSHVLEHFPKNEIISQLDKIKTLLKPDGAVIIMVPNAQANTGAYWAYEDFTHSLLFTSGSLFYVLKSAGYQDIKFLDIDCTAGFPKWKKLLKKILLQIYCQNYLFWNRVTSSAFHNPSPLIFSYEIKALAYVSKTD